MKLSKYIWHAFMIKDMLDNGIYTLTYFHKDNVTRCKKIKKDCEESKKGCEKTSC